VLLTADLCQCRVDRQPAGGVCHICVHSQGLHGPLPVTLQVCAEPLTPLSADLTGQEVTLLKSCPLRWPLTAEPKNSASGITGRHRMLQASTGKRGHACSCGHIVLLYSMHLGCARFPESHLTHTSALWFTLPALLSVAPPPQQAGLPRVGVHRRSGSAAQAQPALGGHALLDALLHRSRGEQA
jgi:hypothetical protein